MHTSDSIRITVSSVIRAAASIVMLSVVHIVTRVIASSVTTAAHGTGAAPTGRASATGGARMHLPARGDDVAPARGGGRGSRPAVVGARVGARAGVHASPHQAPAGLLAVWCADHRHAGYARPRHSCVVACRGGPLQDSSPHSGPVLGGFDPTIFAAHMPATSHRLPPAASTTPWCCGPPT